jgi:hypothetical protein
LHVKVIIAVVFMKMKSETVKSVSVFVELMKCKGPVSHYLERHHFGFILKMQCACSGISHSPPAIKEEIN